MSINNVNLLGRLGKDPELRYTPSGNAVCNFSIATSEQWKDKETGDKKERTEWHSIVVWGKSAERCDKFLAKGRQVYIDGRLQTRKYENKEGVTVYTTEIVANNVQFVDSNKESGGEKPSQSEQTPVDAVSVKPTFRIDEVPF